MPVDHHHNIIEVSDVTFAYSDSEKVLEHITFDIHQGDYFGLIGPNGGGKTTLLRLMLHLLKPQSGTIKIFGIPVALFRQWYRLGYVPQKATQFDKNFPLTVEEAVAMGRVGKAGLFHPLGSGDREIVAKSLRQVEMFDQHQRLIGDLSSGQQQRVFIARALASEPEVIFLDEPTTGVDQTTQKQFYQLLKDLNQKLGLTLILVSHDIEVVASAATEIACVNKTLVYEKNPLNLVGRPTIIHQH